MIDLPLALSTDGLGMPCWHINALYAHNKNIFKGVTLHLSARIIAWSPAPAEIE